MSVRLRGNTHQEDRKTNWTLWIYCNLCLDACKWIFWNTNSFGHQLRPTAALFKHVVAFWVDLLRWQTVQQWKMSMWRLLSILLLLLYRPVSRVCKHVLHLILQMLERAFLNYSSHPSNNWSSPQNALSCPSNCWYHPSDTWSHPPRPHELFIPL